MMDFPVGDLRDEQACYRWLLGLLPPGGLACPRCRGTGAFVHRYFRGPVLDYRCNGCGRVDNAFTGTDGHKARLRPSRIVLILRGFAQGRSTAGLAREWGRRRRHLLQRRHRMQAHVLDATEANPTPLPDGTVEADEMDQNPGKKGVPHTDPDGPPRRRADPVRGHRTWDNDRVPVAGAVGRDSGRLDLKVVHRASRDEPVDGFVVPAAAESAAVYTDEWGPYASLPSHGRDHATVDHQAHQWARDDDGDGEREVHDTTPEGIWAGLREFLRPSRGVSQVDLAQ